MAGVKPGQEQQRGGWRGPVSDGLIRCAKNVVFNLGEHG